MSEDAAAWAALVDTLEPWMSPDWMKNAREHGNQPWIRLVLVVDAHDRLCKPDASEKIAMTMADLADGHDKGHAAGWQAIAEHARDARIAAIAGLVDNAPPLLSPQHQEFFERSVEPSAHIRPS
jgi:hypothetical protein